MTYRELEKEGWIKVSNEKKLDDEVSEEKINEMVEVAYKNSLKYGKHDGINKCLEKRVENLQYRTKNINTIKNISILKNVKNERSAKITDLLVVEDKNGIVLLYDITHNVDYSFDYRKNISVFKGKTKMETFYIFNDEDYQESIKFGYAKSIKLYKNVKLINKHSNELIIVSEFLEFEDVLLNKFFVDVKNNKIYIRDNAYELEISSRKKEKIIFSRN